MNLDKSH